MTDSSGVTLQMSGVGLTFPGGVRALDGVTASIAAGDFVSIVGPSGCGKSTLLRLAAGLLQPTEGALTAGGLQPELARRERHATGFVFQQPTLLPWRTVRGNIHLAGELGHPPVSVPGPAIDQMLSLTGLGEFANARPHELSGGMQMRVSLARALVTRPSLLLLDEPFAALDDITRQGLNEELLALWARDRWTALFVTHNVSEAVFLSRRVIVMSARPGRIIADVEVPFAWPREPELRATPEFARLCGGVSARLREAAS